jgi:hypothetical protein
MDSANLATKTKTHDPARDLFEPDKPPELPAKRPTPAKNNPNAKIAIVRTIAGVVALLLLLLLLPEALTYVAKW